MNIKEIKPISFLFFRTETKLAELGNFLMIGQQLFKEAVSNKLMVTGPIHWHYFGFEGDLNKSFTLEISLPVAEIPQDYDGAFHFKRTEPFKCVRATHDGDWTTMRTTYEKVMQFIQSQQLIPNLVNREVYVNADFKNPEANITEIQVGIN